MYIQSLFMHSKRRTLFLYVFNEGETFVDGRAKTYANILFLYMYDIYIHNIHIQINRTLIKKHCTLFIINISLKNEFVILNSKNLDSYPVWTERKTFPLQNKEN